MAVADASSSRAIANAGHRLLGCPKHMMYGPCGGVGLDGSCELDDRPCPFLERDVVRWIGPQPPPTPPHALLAELGCAVGRPLIVTDLRARPFDRRSVESVVERLATTSDMVLVSDHSDRTDFAPSFLAALVADAGGRPWVTLTCRDRNRVALESELATLVALDAAGVHCVTGDGRAMSVRPDATHVFDLDGTRLAALARQAGLRVSVAETPAAPPLAVRPARLVEKVRAGAQACFVNHSGGAAAVAELVAAVRALGVEVAFIPCVAVFTDVESLVVLERFPGVVIDSAARREVLTAGDGRAAGIAHAVEDAERMLAIDGVVGVNLSGAATSGSERESAAIMSEVAATLRALPRRRP